ncbi:MAG: CinA family protein [Clostridiales bacterium]|nr:CinA family protein [Clostridiales bacterium]
MDRREQVLRTLKAHGLTVSTAESCTGGMVAAALTDLGGSSAVFVGGVVSYWTELKHKILGVSQETLDAYGAVSPQTAQEMAKGVRALTGSDLALSVTGVAGPNRDERDNPVGLVYLALTDGETTAVRQPADLGGTREEIRRNAVEAALEMLLAYFEEKYKVQ